VERRKVLLWIISHVSKEARKDTTYNLVGKTDKDAKLIGSHECCIEDQHPHCMDQLPVAVGDGLRRGVLTKLLPIPISEGIRELCHTMVSNEQATKELI
jgi:hypothetical protein